MKIRPGRAARVARSWNSVGCQVHGRAGHLGPHPRQIEGDVADADGLGGLGRSLGPAQDRPDAGDQLARTERLGEVVVGAQLEPEELVQLVVPRGEHHDRDRRVAPQLPCDVESVEARQTEVEHDQVRPAAAGRRQGSGSVAGGQDGEARVLEVVAGELDDLRFVVDDEDGLHVRAS